MFFLEVYPSLAKIDLLLLTPDLTLPGRCRFLIVTLPLVGALSERDLGEDFLARLGGLDASAFALAFALALAEAPLPLFAALFSFAMSFL